MLCDLKSDTKDTVLSKFATENLIGPETTDGRFPVMSKPLFDKANQEMSDELYREYGIINKFFTRINDYAVFHVGTAMLADSVQKNPTSTAFPLVLSMSAPATDDERTRIAELYDGKAPNGRDSKLSKDQWITVRTKSFQDWFGDFINNPEGSSQVLGENGEPMIMYHGSKVDFEQFDPSKIGTSTDPGWLGTGFYFYGDNNRDQASQYGDVKAYFLNIKDIYYVTDEENTRLSEANSLAASKEFTKMVKDEGYDGAYYNGNLRQETVVYSPQQIKSAEVSVNSNPSQVVESPDLPSLTIPENFESQC